MHLLKGATQGPRPIFCPSPMHVHAVATKFVGAQLEASRQVCRLLAACAGVEAEKQGERGFYLVYVSISLSSFYPSIHTKIATRTKLKTIAVTFWMKTDVRHFSP